MVKLNCESWPDRCTKKSVIIGCWLLSTKQELHFCIWTNNFCFIGVVIFSLSLTISGKHHVIWRDAFVVLFFWFFFSVKLIAIHEHIVAVLHMAFGVIDFLITFVKELNVTCILSCRIVMGPTALELAYSNVS